MPSGPHQGWILLFSFPTGLAQSWTDGTEGEEGIACAEMQRKRAVGAPVLLSGVQGDGWAQPSSWPCSDLREIGCYRDHLQAIGRAQTEP